MRTVLLLRLYVLLGVAVTEYTFWERGRESWWPTVRTHACPELPRTLKPAPIEELLKVELGCEEAHGEANCNLLHMDEMEDDSNLPHITLQKVFFI